MVLIDMKLGHKLIIVPVVNEYAALITLSIVKKTYIPVAIIL